MTYLEAAPYQRLADRQLAIIVLLSTSWPRMQLRVNTIQAAVASIVAGGYQNPRLTRLRNAGEGLQLTLRFPPRLMLSVMLLKWVLCWVCNDLQLRSMRGQDGPHSTEFSGDDPSLSQFI